MTDIFIKHSFPPTEPAPFDDYVHPLNVVATQLAPGEPRGLVARLRSWAAHVPSCGEAADAIEARDRKIAWLERRVDDLRALGIDDSDAIEAREREIAELRRENKQREEIIENHRDARKQAERRAEGLQAQLATAKAVADDARCANCGTSNRMLQEVKDEAAFNARAGLAFVKRAEGLERALAELVAVQNAVNTADGDHERWTARYKAAWSAAQEYATTFAPGDCDPSEYASNAPERKP